jgi:hypothetical protein
MDDKPIHLMTEIENYMLAHAMTPRAFGIAAVNDPKFVFELGAGCPLRPGATTEALAFMGIREFEHTIASIVLAPSMPSKARRRRIERLSRYIAELERELLEAREPMRLAA